MNRGISNVSVVGDIGHGKPVYIIAEIGINHNGDIDIAKQLVDVAVEAGANAVKFQKRTVDVVYTPDDLARERENPFGKTNGDLKRGLEFEEAQYKEIDAHCRKKGIAWFASCWDEGSVDFINQFNPPYYKIASASLTDDALLTHTRSTGKPIILSTGMSTMEEVEHAVSVLGEKDLVLMHTVATYPADSKHLNLRVLNTLQERFPNIPVGYSGHEVGIAPSLFAVALGACVVERHITLDRAMWGSDQAASIEPKGLKLLVRDIRLWQEAQGDGIKRVLEEEESVKKKLRRK